MPKTNTVPVVLQAATRGMRPHESRWLGTVDELALAENIVFEHDLSQKDPAAIIYDPQGVTAVVHTVSLTAPVSHQGTSAMVAALTGATFTAAIAAAVRAAGADPWVVSVGVGAAANAIVVVGIARTDAVPVTPVALGITDSQGHVYSRLSTTSVTDPTTDLWIAQLTHGALVAGVDTWTVTLNGGTNNLAFVAASYAQIGVLIVDRQTTGAPVSATHTWTLANIKTYPLMDVAVLAWNSAVITSTWNQQYTQRVHADSVGIGITLELGDRLYPQGLPIIAQLDFQSTISNATVGNASTVEGSTTVTGAVGVVFLTNLEVGDWIIIGGEEHRVAVIHSNVLLDTVDPWSQTQTAFYDWRDGPRLITATQGGLWGERPGIDQTAPVANQGNLDHFNLVAGGSPLNPASRTARFIIAGKESAGQERKYFFVNGVDVPRAGTDAEGTGHLIATPAADWTATKSPYTQPINGFVHSTSNRLCLFGNLNDAHRLYFADADNHEDFATVNKAFTMRIASQIGERLYGAAEYQGVAWLFKYPVGIFYLDDSPIDFLQWGYRTRSDGLGCAPSPYSVLAINEDVLFMSPDGHMHLLSAVANLGGVVASDLTRQMGLHIWVRDHIDTKMLDGMRSCWNPYNKTAYFAVRSTTPVHDGNDLLLKFDFGLVDRGGQIRFSYSTAWAPSSLCLKRRDIFGTPALMIGESTTSYFVDPSQFGFRTDSVPGTTTPITRGFTSRQRTQSLDFADVNPAFRDVRKLFRSVEFIFGDVLTQPLTCVVEVDGQVRQTLSLTATANRRVEQTLKCGDGYEIAFDLQSDGSVAADLPVLGMIVHCTPGSSDKSRRT